MVGVGKGEVAFPFMRMSEREVDVRFQYRYTNTWPRAIRVVGAGVLSNVRKLVTHRFFLSRRLCARLRRARIRRAGR